MIFRLFRPMICLRGNILQILLLENHPGLCFHIPGKVHCCQYSLRCHSAGCPVSVSPEGFIMISTDAGLLRRYPLHYCSGLKVLQPAASVLNTFQPDNLIRLRIIYPPHTFRYVSDCIFDFNHSKNVVTRRLLYSGIQAAHRLSDFHPWPLSASRFFCTN